MAEVIWDKENDVAQKWIEFVDDNVLASKSSTLVTTVSVIDILVDKSRTPAKKPY